MEAPIFTQLTKDFCPNSPVSLEIMIMGINIVIWALIFCPKDFVILKNVCVCEYLYTVDVLIHD